MQFLLQTSSEKYILTPFIPSFKYCKENCLGICDNKWNCSKKWPIFNDNPNKYNEHEKLLFLEKEKILQIGKKGGSYIEKPPEKKKHGSGSVIEEYDLPVSNLNPPRTEPKNPRVDLKKIPKKINLSFSFHKRPKEESAPNNSLFGSAFRPSSNKKQNENKSKIDWNGKKEENQKEIVLNSSPEIERLRTASISGGSPSKNPILRTTSNKNFNTSDNKRKAFLFNESPLLEGSEPSNMSYIARVYRFENPGIMFFTNLIKKVSKLMYVLEHYRNDLIAIHKKNLLHLSYECKESKHKLVCCIKGTDPKEVIEQLIEIIDSSTKDRKKIKYNTQVICPHCIKKNYDFEDCTKFDFGECVQNFLTGEHIIFCPKEILPKAVPLISFIPEIKLFIKNQLNFEDLNTKKKLGEGAFASVFLGEYQGSQIAVKKFNEKNIFDSEILKFSKSQVFSPSTLRKIKMDINFSPPLKEQRENRKMESLKKKDFTSSIAIWNDFCKETLIMKKLVHPCLVKLIGVCVSPLCIVTEFMPFGDLHGFIHDKKNTLSHELILKITLDIASALYYLHSQEPAIVHCKHHNYF